MSTETKKPFEVVFAPGCFDDFEGSQEELNALIAEITALGESGDLLELGVDVNDVDEEEFQYTLPSGNRNVQ